MLRFLLLCVLFFFKNKRERERERGTREDEGARKGARMGKEEG